MAFLRFNLNYKMSKNNSKEIYSKIYHIKNLIFAWKKARKGKTKKVYVIEFEKDLGNNLRQLKFDLMSQTYKPKPLVNFIIKDPKTRKISKSAFRDRIVHHAIVRAIEPIFDKSFIYDSCANRIGKGNLFALRRLELFEKKVTCNLRNEAFCLKADIRHYFEEINHDILLNVIQRKIVDEKVMWLIKQIISNTPGSFGGGKAGFTKKGMPLGNLTSQFFANIYLNELDHFVKHNLKTKYYIRYVDDFVILHENKEQLKIWKKEIEVFLKEKLKLELHPDKSKIISLSKGVDFVGFRNFYHYRLLRKRNIRKILAKIKGCKDGKISKDKLLESFNGWNAYARWADSFKLRKEIIKLVYSADAAKPSASQ
ncbi:MAG: reverse transcriptase/maturase family protein [Candidatus Pacearchaeota archaeon]